MLYVDNIVKTQRTDGQAESIKFVVRFWEKNKCRLIPILM
jgi:hypothetical protein